MLVQETIEYLEVQLKDGFQIEDIGNTVKFVGKKLVRMALDEVPGDDGKAKSEWVRARLYEIVNGLSEAARSLFGQGLAWFVSGALVALVKDAGKAAVDWAIDNLVEPFIKWAYMDEVADRESPVTSKSLMAALVGNQ